MRVHLRRPWLIADLGARRRVASWSVNRPGLVETDRIVWREVRDADLGPELDVGAWLAGELAAEGLEDAVCLLTSRDLRARVQARATVEDATATALATVGLGNAQRVGARTAARFKIGTINIAVSASTPLSDGALLELLSLVAEARTLALLEAKLAVAGGWATGTGTDCAAVAAPAGLAPHAGKHTAIGEAVGRATLAALRTAVRDWTEENGGGHGGD